MRYTLVNYEGYVVETSRNNAVRLFNFDKDIKFRKLLSSKNTSKGSVTHKSHIFVDKYLLPMGCNVCNDAKRSMEIDNAGGKSNVSEMFSIDYFHQMYGAVDTIFEKEVKYWIDYKMVDFISTINGNRVGVSVARAMGYPSSKNFTEANAHRLLLKKLSGLVIARNAVVKEQRFFKSILHIWCQDQHVAKLMKEAFERLDENDYGLDVKGVLLLQLTICDDQQIYKNLILN